MKSSGIYEQLITQLVEKKLESKSNDFYIGKRLLEKEDAAIWVTRFLSRLIERVMASVPEHDESRVYEQISLANRLIHWLSEHINDDDFISENLLDTQGYVLTALFNKSDPIAADLSKYAELIMPETGLTHSELFCGSNVGVSLESELKREIQSADEIYWLVSFIKWTGIRIFKKELEDFTRAGKKLRVITTSYMGATDAKAVEFLASLPNTEVKLSYNTQRERLHAKSYLFKRNSGFHTGYIGSSNLSHSALTKGLEWNLKVTSQEISQVIDKSLKTFETYWESSDFEFFDGEIESKQKLQHALQEARGGEWKPNSNFYFDVIPHSHQQRILDQLQAERRVHNRYKNLVVAATGTGKTIISAFDFERYYRQNPEAKFLFIAHREEILKQAQSAYRGVLKNGSFGELWVGSYKPSSYKHLFTSIQTLNSQLLNLELSPGYYDYIVIDEVHHISAKSYRAVLEHFSPHILLGLTATPERQDGADILNDFCDVIAADIRLPEAINQRLLTPFQYFCIDDDTDISNVSWTKGHYDISELTQIYTHNDQRVIRIINSMNEIITDITQMKALAFCVSKEHAKYMAQKFTLYNIPCGVLTSDNRNERDIQLQKLKSKQIHVLFVVDMFNEGVDIPELNTLLFLRPTESLTVFLQQLGRGLRLTKDKECCTILDFVGNARSDYDFTHKFSALMDKSTQSMAKEIKQGFPHLPLGCRIELQEKAQEIILRNISQAILNKNKLLNLIRNFKNVSSLPLTLSNFLIIYPHITIEDIYKVKIGKFGGWEVLLAESHGYSIDATEIDIYSAYYRAINNRLLMCSSLSYLKFVKYGIERGFNWDDYQSNNSEKELMALMLHYDFWDQSGTKSGFNILSDSFKKLGNDELQNEMLEVIQILMDRLDINEFEMGSLLSSNFDLVPLKMHARYPKEHILVAFGDSSFEKKSSSREGVLSIKGTNTELFFVTLNKCEKQFSVTTMYHDYAISDTLFYWQTQNSSKPESGRGLSYIQQVNTDKTCILFVREQAKDEFGRTMGFVNFGPVDFVKYEGSQPMNITWKLRHPMPAYMWHDTAKLSVG